MDYEDLLKIILAIIGSLGGLFLTVRTMYKIYTERYNSRELSIKSTDYDISAKGLTEKEIKDLIKTIKGK